MTAIKKPQHRGNGLGHGTNHQERHQLMTNTTVAEPVDTIIEIPCTRAHCDRQGMTHRLDLDDYADLDEALQLVPHHIDLGGVFRIDALGDTGPWLFYTNHGEVMADEIDWWITQANTAAKLCLDLNTQATA